MRPLRITQTLDGRVLMARGAHGIELQLDELPPTIELLQFALQFKEIDVRRPGNAEPRFGDCKRDATEKAGELGGCCNN